ncbi:histidine phosphatase family protein [Pseudomonas sp. DC3200b2]|uniref:histidine phosphatase family protein n=1 Tax=Pseudomonas sp. DC3200b2 TaxID=2804669 RepID=UPI003CE87E34
MGNLYLIRHGQASFGAADYDVLSTVGQRQAELLGDFLAQADIQLHRCVSGGLRRQQDTARHALARLPYPPRLETDPRFDEFDAQGLIRALLPGLLDTEPEAGQIMRNAAHHPREFQRLFERLVSQWLEGDVPSASESWGAFLARTVDAVTSLLRAAAPGENIAVFTSGGVITALLHRYTGLAPSEAFRLNWQIYNSSLNHLRFKGCDVTLVSFNGHAHLQLAQAPELITWR